MPEETGPREKFVSFDTFWQQTDVPGVDAILDPLKKLKEEQEEIRRQSAAMLQKAKENAAGIEKEAYEKGYAQGEQDGRAEGRSEFEGLIKRLEAILEEVHAQRDKIYQGYHRDLLTLIKTMVDRLVNHEVSVNPRIIQACLRNALEFVVGNSVVKVHLHADDFNRLKEASLEDPSVFAGHGRIQMVEDPDVSPGGCLLDTAFGEVDATLENCREKLYEAVDRAFMAALAQHLP